MLRDSEDEVRQFLQEALLPRKGTRRFPIFPLNNQTPLKLDGLV
jgi:hypothetical protein